MYRSIETLYKIFKLEAQLNYENKAVVGGLEKLADTWVGEARAEELDEDAVQKTIAILKRYPQLDTPARADALKQVGKILDVAGMKHLPASPAERAPQAATETQPARSDKPASQAAPAKRGSTRKRRAGPAPLPDIVNEQGLNAPTTAVRGIGDKQSALLEKLGLLTIEDMLYYFPFRYDDYSELKPIRNLEYGEEVTILAWVKSIKTFQIPNKKRKVTQVIVSDSTGSIQLMWFNQPYQTRYLRKDMFLSISGKIEQYMGRLVMYHPEYEQVDKQQLNTNRIVPVYRLTAKLSQRWLRRIMHNVVSYWSPKIPDFVTEYILEDADLMDLSTALMEIHFPENKSNLKKARHRLAFDEIFLLHLGMLRQRYEWTHEDSQVFKVSDEWLANRAMQLPFELTSAQLHALDDIRDDLASGHPMSRLLQGDVGSGKTVVAALGMSVVLENGAQGAFMAPTSILAEQHYASLQRILANAEDKSACLRPEEIRLLIGDTPAAEREDILAGLADGSVKVLVGTHALIQDPVQFQNLQYIVVDEQHRFGVAQRAALREKGENPHLLVMTATPIPRSLALTVMGDLDISVIDELPAGRQPVQTHILYPTERERVYTLIRSQAEQGHQAFIIYPLVEQGDRDETLAAVEERDRLQKDIFRRLKVGLLHGRLNPAEKEEVMRKFRDKEYDILVSTSVVEVGVDIPNATVMLIEGANRFGLAQLHQFRGRVGRSADQSYCILIPEKKDQAENERLQAMEKTTDGFVLAHYARQVFDNDPTLSAPEHQLMSDALDHFWPADEGERS
jgi:ATP-dependent DNA helicase RecG